MRAVPRCAGYRRHTGRYGREGAPVFEYRGADTPPEDCPPADGWEPIYIFEPVRYAA